MKFKSILLSILAGAALFTSCEQEYPVSDPDLAVKLNPSILVFDGKENSKQDYYAAASRSNSFSLRNYLDILFTAQGAEAVSSKEDADIILVMGKPVSEKEQSLIDRNFFLEA